MKKRTLLSALGGVSSNGLSVVALVGLALALPACEDYPLHDLGNTVTQASTASPPELDPGPPVAQRASEFAGVWLGQAEDPFALESQADFNSPVFRFPSGSTHIWLQLDTDEQGVAFGTLTFGDLPPPPPAEDADRGYPIDPDFRIDAGSGDGSVLPPTEGFPYTLSAGFVTRDIETQADLDAVFYGAVVDGKLEFSYVPAQLFESWCPLQTAESCVYDQISYDDAGTSCSVNTDLEPMDCQKADLCMSQVCECYEGFPCTYSVQRLSTLSVRLSNDGRLVGLFSGAVFVNERGFQQPLGTVHFRRVEPGDSAP